MGPNTSFETCFTADFSLKNSLGTMVVYNNGNQNIVKLRIFEKFSSIFESAEIRRFQGALIGLKMSAETCFRANLPLKNAIWRSKKLIKVKEKS